MGAFPSADHEGASLSGRAALGTRAVARAEREPLDVRDVRSGRHRRRDSRRRATRRRRAGPARASRRSRGGGLARRRAGVARRGSGAAVSARDAPTSRSCRPPRGRGGRHHRAPFAYARPASRDSARRRARGDRRSRAAAPGHRSRAHGSGRGVGAGGRRLEARAVRVRAQRACDRTLRASRLSTRRAQTTPSPPSRRVLERRPHGEGPVDRHRQRQGRAPRRFGAVG